jgi:hypothetical protein
MESHGLDQREVSAMSKSVAHQIATATPAEGERLFAALSAQEQVAVIVAAAAELGLVLQCTVRCAAFARALKAMPEVRTLPDAQYFACYPNRRARVRYPWNAELDPAPEPVGGCAVVIAVQRVPDGLHRIPLLMGAQFAASVIRTGGTEAEVEAAIAGVEPLPGVVCRDVRAVR